MFVIIKKYKFHIKKTNFVKFIIRLRQTSIDLKKNQSYCKLARLKKCYKSKIIFRILQLLQEIYYKIVKENRTVHPNNKKRQSLKIK